MKIKLKAAMVGVGVIAVSAVTVPVLNNSVAVTGTAAAEKSIVDDSLADEPDDDQIEDIAFLQNSPTAEAAGKPKYTNATTLVDSGCPIYLNIPDGGEHGAKPNPSAAHWTKPAKDEHGRPLHVGVRYTLGGDNGYALVLDYARSSDPHWGFIEKRCLQAKHARGPRGEVLGDLQAVGGNNKVKAVTLEARHEGKQRRKEIHLDSTGTFRNRPQAFVIGNLEKGNTFVLPTESCGRHGGEEWILGYSTRTERWGYMQAKHLPACTA